MPTPARSRVATVLPVLVASGCMENAWDYQFLSGPNGWSGETRYDDADADVWFDVATTSLQVSRDPAVNRERIAARIDEIVAARPDVGIILFGETITGWYHVGDDHQDAVYQKSVAEPVGGQTTQLVAGLAAEHGIHVAFGIAESAPELYNSLVLVGPDGEVQAVHRKFLTVHSDVVASLDDPYQNGDGPTVTEIDGVPFGLMICNDMHSYVVADGFAAAGVRVVLSALADTAPAPEGWSPIPTIYDSWLVQANRYGTEGDTTYPGAISIVDPAGAVRESMDGDGWVATSMGVYR